MENYLIDYELVDTYGGDYTYRDVWYELDENGKYTFYEKYYGPNSSDETLIIDDPNEIEELKKLI